MSSKHSSHKEIKSVWSITSLLLVTEKVAFDEEVTRDEALKLYGNNEYADIIDCDYTPASGEIIAAS